MHCNVTVCSGICVAGRLYGGHGCPSDQHVTYECGAWKGGGADRVLVGPHPKRDAYRAPDAVQWSPGNFGVALFELQPCT